MDLRFQHPLMRPRRPKSPATHVAKGSSPELDSVMARATGPGARDPELGRLEAVLFIAQEPLASRKLAQLASLADGTKARTLVRTLNRYYDREGSAFRVEEIAGGLQLLSRPQFAPWLRRIQPRPVEIRLSAPALETMAVVAYRQPVLRVEVEAVRGVQCGEILRQLIERDLVRIAGRSEELGRPLLYGTTKRFLQVFGLRSLEELPRADLMRAAAESAETFTPVASDTDINQPTPNASVPIEEKQVTTTIAPPGTEAEFAAVPAAIDDPRADVEQFDADDDLDDDGDEEEDDFEDDEDYEDDEDVDDDEEDDEEDDDFEDDDWEEVGDEDEDEDEDEDDDWDDDDWDDDDEEVDDDDEEDEEEEESDY